jgi:uncharacterized protein YndB with AHSA1/START domain
MTSESDQWTSFTLKADIKASQSEIYHCWSTQRGIESWFLRSALYKHSGGTRGINELVQAGDHYKWLWHGYPDYVTEEREILEANGKDTIRFTFSAGCPVTVKIIEQGERCLVELTQEEIPPENDPKSNLYVQCSIGWTFYLANLKSMLEGGVDLRNKQLNLDSAFK